MRKIFVSRTSGDEDGNDNLEATEVLSVSGDDDLSCEVRPGGNKIVVFLLGTITSVNQLARHISILAEAMPSRNGVEVLMSASVGLIHDLLEVCFPHHIAIPIEDLKVTIKGGVQDGEILVNPREWFFSKGDIERGVARFGSSRRVDGYLVGWRDSEVFLSNLEDADSGIIVRLRPS